jgi:hypothetical protein
LGFLVMTPSEPVGFSDPLIVLGIKFQVVEGWREYIGDVQLNGLLGLGLITCEGCRIGSLFLNQLYEIKGFDSHDIHGIFLTDHNYT